MDWMQIISAVALIMFIIVLYPAARDMMKNSPQVTSSDWLSIIAPMQEIN